MGAQVGLLLMAESRNLKQTKWDSYLMAMADMIHVQHRRSGKECRMLGGGAGTPAFLSTHPNPVNRKAALEAMMPKALEYYRAAGGKL
jgi:Zn-dependent protease with chaperone function